MADRTSANIFGSVFALIDEHVKDPTARALLALKFWALKEKANCDFSDYQMSSDKALINLGLARLGPDPDYPEDGPRMLYGPEGEAV